MKRSKVTENTTLPFTGKAPNEHQALPVRQTTNRSRAAETLEGSPSGDQEAAHALDAGVESQKEPIEMNQPGICIGRGNDGCGYTGGLSGDTCPNCGGMILSEQSIKMADEVQRVWETRDREAEPIHSMNVTDDLDQIIVTPRDWPEDFSHENGAYLNHCHNCQITFIGHKRRITCKVCAESAKPIIANALNEGTYQVTNQDGTTGTITVKTGSSLTIWTQSTIERV